MMMSRALLLLSSVSTAIAAPAVVWQSGSTTPVHSSEAVSASSLVKSAVEGASESALAVVFVVGRDRDGTESLGRLASSGALPLTASKYDTASAIHHHVGGVESAAKLAEHAGAEAEVIGLSEVDRVVTSSPKSSVVVVSASHQDDASALDAAVSKALSSKNVKSVVLTAQRSVEEVKNERALSRRRNKSIKKKRKVLSNRRRLEDADEEEEEEEEEQDESEVAYYVSMTPNILAGVLFTFFFIFVSHLGLMCMGMISNSDVFATKLPAVGREA